MSTRNASCALGKSDRHLHGGHVECLEHDTEHRYCARHNIARVPHGARRASRSARTDHERGLHDDRCVWRRNKNIPESSFGTDNSELTASDPLLLENETTTSKLTSTGNRTRSHGRTFACNRNWFAVELNTVMTRAVQCEAIVTMRRRAACPGLLRHGPIAHHP